jgi:hypothetical protein
MRASAETLDYNRLEPGAVVDVETKSRHYRIECLGGNSVRISGHPQYCPSPVNAHLEGSLNQDGMLDAGLIECGHRLLFVVEDRIPITTSKVLHVQCESKTC